MKSSETVTLKQRSSDSYEVIGLTNRMYPIIGDCLDSKQVEKLLVEAHQSRHKLTIKITG